MGLEGGREGEREGGRERGRERGGGGRSIEVKMVKYKQSRRKEEADEEEL